MTEAEHVYFGTLNLLGSDVEPPEIQEMLDREHAKADPAFARHLERVATLERLKAHRFVTSLNHSCGVFETDGERSLYRLAAENWNRLQELLKLTETLLREHEVEHNQLRALTHQARTEAPA